MNIFSERTGHVVMVPDVGFPLTIRPQHWPGAIPMRAVLTQLGLSSQGNHQFMHTLRNFVYVYIFGEKMGEIMLGGIAFPGVCGEVGEPTGLEMVYKYYTRFRVSQRGAPLSIAVGAGLAFQGWLTAFKADTVNPEIGLTQFLMRFNFFPGQVLNNQDGTTTLDDGDEDFEEWWDDEFDLQTGIVDPGVPPERDPRWVRRTNDLPVYEDDD